MPEGFVSRKAKEAQLYPKSSGESANNENQIITPFKWENNADKTEVIVSLKDKYVFDVSVIRDIIYPVGCFYTQYPNADSNDLAITFPDAYRPADLFGGTWVAQWDDEGIDFHTERTSDVGLQTRTDGKQADQMQQITGSFTRNRLGYNFGGTQNGAFSAAAGISSNAAAVDTTNPSTKIVFDSANSPDARTGTVTCDANRLVRIWKRTA